MVAERTGDRGDAGPVRGAIQLLVAAHMRHGGGKRGVLDSSVSVESVGDVTTRRPGDRGPGGQEF